MRETRESWFAGRKMRVVSSLAVLVALLVSSSPSVSEAFPFDSVDSSRYCGFTKFDYVVITGSGAPSGPIQIAAKNGIEEWDGLASPDGGTLVEVDDVASGNVITVKWVNQNIALAGWVEAGHCNDPLKHVYLNTKYLTNAQLAQDTARHEIGHVLGAGHTGAGDGIGTRPTMTTCELSLDRTLMRDDRAVVNRHARGSLTPNEGFEEGSLEDWDTWAQPATVQSFFPAQGSYYVSIPTSAALFQEMNYFDPGTSGRKVQARVTSRTGLPSSSGVAGILWLHQRDASYELNSPPDPCITPDRFPGGDDHRWDLDRTGNGNYSYRTAIYIIHSPSWTSSFTGNVDMKVGSYGTGHTQDLRIRVFNSSGYTLNIDDLALYDAGPG